MESHQSKEKPAEGKWEKVSFTRLRRSPHPTSQLATNFASVTRQGHQKFPSRTNQGQLLFAAPSFYYVAAALARLRHTTLGGRAGCERREKQFCQLINSKNKMPD